MGKLVLSMLEYRMLMHIAPLLGQADAYRIQAQVGQNGVVADLQRVAANQRCKVDQGYVGDGSVVHKRDAR